MEVREEALHGERNVVRQPRLHDAVAEERRARRASGRRHVREHYRAPRIVAHEPLDERRDGAGFAERDRVDPQHVVADDACRTGVASEALAHAGAIERLAPAAPPKPQRQERKRTPPQRRVGEARHARSTGTRAGPASAASRTASTSGGAPASPTSRAWAPAQATPCRPRSVTVKIATVRVPSAAARCVNPVSTPTASV